MCVDPRFAVSGTPGLSSSCTTITSIDHPMHGTTPTPDNAFLSRVLPIMCLGLAKIQVVDDAMLCDIFDGIQTIFLISL